MKIIIQIAIIGAVLAVIGTTVGYYNNQGSTSQTRGKSNTSDEPGVTAVPAE